MLRQAARWILLASFFWSLAARGAGYPAPGSPEVGGVRHLCLVYHGNATRVRWTQEAILPYVAHVDAQGLPTDWMFDSFLFMEYIAPDGAFLHHYEKKFRQPTATDWSWLAGCWFRDEVGLAGLENAVAAAGETLKQPNHVVNVVITLPNPFRQLTSFGTLPALEGSLNFSKPSDRRRALVWYIDHVLDRWKDAKYRHLRLAGFYWPDETMDPEDVELVRAVANYVHEKSYKLYWIPYFGANGVQDWRKYGFDAAMLQPHYYQPPTPPAGRFTATSRSALSGGLGIEMEFDARVLDSADFRDRFWAYLDAGAHYGWMTESLIGYYEGSGALKKLVEAGGAGRQMYDALYAFIKGTYTPVGKLAVEDRLDHRDSGESLTLVSRGAKITGATRPEGKPQLSPEQMIDGQNRYYDGGTGYGYFPIPGSMVVALPSEQTVAVTQTHLWDRDGRFYRYRIDTSLDGKEWSPAVDKSTGEWRGWQVDRFPPRKARFIRITGLFNSAGSNFQLVQFEAYSK